jgi:hypothetical protein
LLFFSFLSAHIFDIVFEFPPFWGDDWTVTCAHTLLCLQWPSKSLDYYFFFFFLLLIRHAAEIARRIEELLRWFRHTVATCLPITIKPFGGRDIFLIKSRSLWLNCCSCFVFFSRIDLNFGLFFFKFYNMQPNRARGSALMSHRVAAKRIAETAKRANCSARLYGGLPPVRKPPV